MCDILDEYAKEYAKDYVEEYVEGRLREKEIRNAKELFDNDLSVAMVKKISELLSEEELNELFEETTDSRKK